MAPELDQGFRDFEGLLTRVGLGYQQIVRIDAQLLGVAGVQGVLGVDKCGQAACPLGFRNDLQRDSGFARGLRAVDLSDAAAGHATHAKCSVKADGTR